MIVDCIEWRSDIADVFNEVLKKKIDLDVEDFAIGMIKRMEIWGVVEKFLA